MNQLTVFPEQIRSGNCLVGKKREDFPFRVRIERKAELLPFIVFFQFRICMLPTDN